MKIRCLLLTLFSALLLFLAIPNEIFAYGSPLFGSIALVPLYTAVRKAPTLRFSSLSGVVFGTASSLLIYYWLMFFQDFSTWTITGTTFGYALYFSILFPYLTALTRTDRAYRPLLFAAAWTIFEYFKSTGYLGFPWGLIPYPFHQLFSLIQIVDITGIWGLSFLIAFFNAVVGETVLRSSRPTSIRKSLKQLDITARHWITAALLLVLCCSYGVYRLNTEIPIRKRLSVLLVQQNIDSWLSGNEIKSLKIGQDLTREGLAETDTPIELIVWSETALSRPLDEYRDFFMERPQGDPFLPFLKEIDTYMLIGAPYAVDWESYAMMNSAILLSPEGEIVEHYGKQHPVPLAEHIPFWELEPVRNFFTKYVGLYSAGWVLGKEYTVFSVPGSSITGEETQVSFGTPICFEDAFPNICRRLILNGADILINLTNDSWSKKVSAETQHYVVALFRAVETKRVLIRSTNAGVTAVIGPHGKALKSLPLFTEAYLAASVPIYTESAVTPYTRYGDILPFLCMGLVVVVLIMRRIRSRSTLL